MEGPVPDLCPVFNPPNRPIEIKSRHTGFINRPHRWEHADDALDDVATDLRTAFEGED